MLIKLLKLSGSSWRRIALCPSSFFFRSVQSFPPIQLTGRELIMLRPDSRLRILIDLSQTLRDDDDGRGGGSNSGGGYDGVAVKR